MTERGATHRNGHGDRAGHAGRAPEKGWDGIDQNGGHCPVCTSPAYSDDRFCEACGTPLRAQTPLETGDADHREIDLGPVAGVCDRGIRHTTNEDAMGVAMVGSTLIGVVCDGVSSTPGSGPAAQAAAAAAAAVLAEAVRSSYAARGQPLQAGQPTMTGTQGSDGFPDSDEHVPGYLRPPDDDRDRQRPAGTAGTDRFGYGDIGEDDDRPGYRDPYGGYGSDDLQWPASDIPPTPPKAVADGFSEGDFAKDDFSHNDVPPDDFSRRDAENAIHAAVAAAQAAVVQAPVVDGRISPSCTFAAAVITRSGNGGGSVTVGWIGDSRVYLLGPGRVERLSEDDTWAAEAARAGLIPAAAVETDRRAHTLTRWLGADARDVTAHIRVFPLVLPATVLVCTDGMWNYLSRAEDLAAVVGELPPDAPAIMVGRHLTRHAIDHGGHDNITVVTARIGAARSDGHSGDREPR
ncbi:protein phosphatase 2C domain-containing protein [Frankia sp. Cr2]|uniref:protein phosphatase 2C domain-containing protein n=1 Tax=Frankia sp. Cr2 TaxID=3073932 RepID=UPI002AD4A276|nr:protein phosphatase 2C domain-containing protein [Frankia sp. Cr2]